MYIVGHLTWDSSCFHKVYLLVTVPSKFYIVSMVTDTLMGKMDLKPILSVTCKRTFRVFSHQVKSEPTAKKDLGQFSFSLQLSVGVNWPLKHLYNLFLHMYFGLSPLIQC